MKRIIFFFLISFILSFLVTDRSYAQVKQEKIIELYGVVYGKDSSNTLPGASIYIHGTNRGTISNNVGLFSIVASPGDVVDVSFIGYKTQSIQIPKNITDNQWMISPTLEEDTAYLPTTFLTPLPMPAVFKLIFLNMPIDRDYYALASENVNVKNMLRQMRYYRLSTPGAINMMHQQQTILQNSQKGLMPSTGIINPYSWYDFIKSLKNGSGDY